MSERSCLLESIAETIKDYRAGEIPEPTPDHVEKWVNQFDADVQLPLLSEMDHILKKTYLSKEKVKRFLHGLLRHKNLVGEDPCAFWKNVKFLNKQGAGGSQRDMLSMFDEILKAEYDFGVDECGVNLDCYMYIDDGVFTGNRVKNDIGNWIKSNGILDGAKIHIVLIALHVSGKRYINKSIEGSVGKKINMKWWSALGINDWKSTTSESDVLHPTCIPKDDAVSRYVKNMKEEIKSRTRFASYSIDINEALTLRSYRGTGPKEFFKSNEGRHLLEQEFLKAGARIREKSPNLPSWNRPLGYAKLVTLGFGSLVVTFRNCPNATPLVFWVGDSWYPLFPRVTNRQMEDRREMEALLEAITDAEI